MSPQHARSGSPLSIIISQSEHFQEHSFQRSSPLSFLVHVNKSPLATTCSNNTRYFPTYLLNCFQHRNNTSNNNIHHTSITRNNGL